VSGGAKVIAALTPGSGQLGNYRTLPGSPQPTNGRRNPPRAAGPKKPRLPEDKRGLGIVS